MAAKKNFILEKTDSSAAIAYEHTYSAQELGEMMNTNPLGLLKIDIGYQTRWFNCDYIEEILTFVRSEADMKMLMSLIVNDWQKKTAEHHSRVAYRNVETREYVPYVTGLPMKLDEICKRLLADREKIQQASAFRQLFLQKYSQPDSMSAPESKHGSPSPQVNLTNIDESADEEAGELEFRLEDFNRHKLRCLTISDERVFDNFVRIMRNEVWPFVCTNKNKYCNVLRFVCMVHGIIGEKTNMPEFDDLLQGIIPGLPSQLSSMKKRKDANMKKNLRNYRDPLKRRNNDCYQLANDCPPIEKMLQTVIDAVKDN